MSNPTKNTITVTVYEDAEMGSADVTVTGLHGEYHGFIEDAYESDEYQLFIMALDRMSTSLEKS